MQKPGLVARFLGAVKIGRMYLSHRKGLTAFAGGGQTGAILLPRAMNEVHTVATTGDSVKLPPFVESLQVVVANAGANSMTVYSFETTGVTINGTAGSTGVAQASGKTAIYYGAAAGAWVRLLSA